MPPNSTAAELLAAVQASPRAVTAHDRAAWVGLFTADAVVNDPVGSRPHTGRDAIERFYDTFIAPNTIVFAASHDIVCPPTVFRDLTIEITMSAGATVAVPMHLRYDLADQDGHWKIARLHAHWELGPMIGQLLRTGGPGLLAGLQLGRRLVRHQGIGGATGMLRALVGVGDAGKDEAERVFSAAAATEIGDIRGLLGADTIVELGGNRVTIEEFTNRTRNMVWDKLIAAGNTVTASVLIGEAPGIALVEFVSSTGRITAVRLFLDR
ncbi:nuclear transport factor 2 family protein [Nocardia arthritidis]|uniref:SnoaL-like domain-containing protein n=1 Tax=Nocardia arthritidis TaxID=228602 RepID=A0A6G9YPI0_9NOCA|nr:nuclear transport factor 2 family protein [Nocardia arthritidis]QIS15098.1 hypothetical protein F5544_36345 [Nocardia arthritidis]